MNKVNVSLGCVFFSVLLGASGARAEQKTQFRLELEHINDNLPRQMSFLYPEDDLSRGTPDDDGWTAELGLNFAVERGPWSLLWQSRAQMVTQKRQGDYSGLRQDILESALLLSHKHRVSSRLELEVGAGFGLQSIGEQGLYTFQRWVHETFPIGGRILRLQKHYPDVFVIAPSASVGSALRYRLHRQWLFAYGEVNTTLGIGALHRTRTALGVQAQAFGLNASLEVILASLTSGEGVLEFIDSQGNHLGACLRIEYLIKNRVGAFGAFSFGGIRSEPVYTLGIVVAAPKSRRQRVRPLF